MSVSITAAPESAIDVIAGGGAAFIARIDQFNAAKAAAEKAATTLGSLRAEAEKQAGSIVQKADEYAKDRMGEADHIFEKAREAEAEAKKVASEFVKAAEKELALAKAKTAEAIAAKQAELDGAIAENKAAAYAARSAEQIANKVMDESRAAITAANDAKAAALKAEVEFKARTLKLRQAME